MTQNRSVSSSATQVATSHCPVATCGYHTGQHRGPFRQHRERHPRRPLARGLLSLRLGFLISKAHSTGSAGPRTRLRSFLPIWGEERKCGVSPRFGSENLVQNPAIPARTPQPPSEGRARTAGQGAAADSPSHGDPSPARAPSRSPRGQGAPPPPPGEDPSPARRPGSRASGPVPSRPGGCGAGRPAGGAARGGRGARGARGGRGPGQGRAGRGTSGQRPAGPQRQREPSRDAAPPGRAVAGPAERARAAAMEVVDETEALQRFFEGEGPARRGAPPRAGNPLGPPRGLGPSPLGTPDASSRLGPLQVTGHLH